MFHTPAHKQPNPCQIIPGDLPPLGSIEGDTEFDATDAKVPTTIAELAAIAEEIDADNSLTRSGHAAYDRLLAVIRAANAAPVKKLVAVERARASLERSCVTCQHWHTPGNKQPCVNCLPKAADLPSWVAVHVEN